MTKTIKNITPRAVGDTFDVAYLSDLSTLNSGLATKIEHIRKAIGGSDWELSSEALTFQGLNYIGNGSYSIEGAFENLDTNLVLDIGTDGDYGSHIYNIDPSATVKTNIYTLDEKLGLLTGSQYNIINAGNAVTQNLEALDSAIGIIVASVNFIANSNTVAQNLESLDLNLYYTFQDIDKINGGLGHQFSSSDGAVTFTGTYVGATTTYGDAIEALDSQLDMAWQSINQNFSGIQTNSQSIETLNTDLDNLNGRVGYAASETGWDTAHYIAGASDLTNAAITLDEVIYNVRSAAGVTVEKQETAETGYAHTYVVKQGGTQVGAKINIPKDFLVKSAALSTVTTADVPYAGAKVGDKYIDFVINAKDASATAEHIYLPVNDLVDVYTAQQNATQVQLAIDANNVISATIVDSSVTTVKIADGAITTAKIADGAVNTNKIRLIDTATTGQYAGKAYTLQVTNGRLQVKELPSQTTI